MVDPFCQISTPLDPAPHLPQIAENARNGIVREGYLPVKGAFPAKIDPPEGIVIDGPIDLLDLS